MFAVCLFVCSNYFLSLLRQKIRASLESSAINQNLSEMPKNTKSCSNDRTDTKQEQSGKNTRKWNVRKFLNLQALSSNRNVDDDAENTRHCDRPQSRVASKKFKEARSDDAEHVRWAHLEHEGVQVHGGTCRGALAAAVREGEGGRDLVVLGPAEVGSEGVQETLHFILNGAEHATLVVDGPADHGREGKNGETKKGIDRVAVSTDEANAIEEHGDDENEDENLNEADVGAEEEEVLERGEEADQEGIHSDKDHRFID